MRKWTTEKIGEWNKKQFKRDGLYSCRGLLNHAKRELNELIQAHVELEKDPEDEFSRKALDMEVADMFILMEAYAHIAGVDIDNVVDHKMFINENRKWNPTDAEGVAEHVDESKAPYKLEPSPR